MINRIIEFSGNNKFLVFILIGFAVIAGLWSMQNIPLDARSRSERHSGYRIFAVGPQPRHHRRPGNLSDRDLPARSA